MQNQSTTENYKASELLIGKTMDVTPTQKRREDTRQTRA